MLRNILKKKKPITRIQILHFREAGFKPFLNFDFANYNVYKISSFDLESFEKLSHLYNDLKEIEGNFEIWVVPTLIDVKKSLDGYVDFIIKSGIDAKDYITKITEMRSSSIYERDEEFLIIDKLNDMAVKQILCSKSYSLSEKNKDELCTIEVTNK